MKKKGFTLVELLVVIAIIALLMSILMPALAQVRRLAQRMMCGTNLKGLGTAIVTYGDDNRERSPKTGRSRSRWFESTPQQLGDVWEERAIRAVWPDLTIGEAGRQATIGSCWYLLIKYCDVTPKQFICGGDQGTMVFKLSDHLPATSQKTLTDVWDFGGGAADTFGHAADPGIHYSYSYHNPFNTRPTGRTQDVEYPLSTAGNPASPVASDRNTYLCSNAATYKIPSPPDTLPPNWAETTRTYIDSSRVSIPAAHQREGFNVLYLDAHVEWEKFPNCGIENDNIFQPWPNDGPTAKEKQFGGADNPGTLTRAFYMSRATGGPRNDTDAVLINEEN